jgi:putative ABC transport system ATP-binding protein
MVFRVCYGQHQGWFQLRRSIVDLAWASAGETLAFLGASPYIRAWLDLRDGLAAATGRDSLAYRQKRQPVSAIVEITDVYKDYPLGKTVVRALRGVTLTIDKGEFTSIAGPSGSGKTTLLNLVGCVDTATRGTVKVDGEETTHLRERMLTRLRLHKLGFIFQTFNLVPVLNVFQNIELPLLLQRTMSKAGRRQRVEDIVDRVGLTEQMTQRPNELSGGQRQRVAIARALVTRPVIVLADEPTANLDSATGHTIIEVMRELNRRDHTTFIFSTHDLRVMELADRVIQLVDGRIAEPEAASEVLATPPSGGR